MARDVTKPNKTRSDMRARAFARWFWFNAADEGEVVSLETDLGLYFSTNSRTELGWHNMYLCNQRIYSPRHARGERIGKERLKKLKPGTTVIFVYYRISGGNDPVIDFDAEGYAQWVDGIKSKYELLDQDSLPFARYDKRERRRLSVDYLDVYKCRVKGSSPRGSANNPEE